MHLLPFVLQWSKPVGPSTLCWFSLWDAVALELWDIHQRPAQDRSLRAHHFKEERQKLNLTAHNLALYTVLPGYNKQCTPSLLEIFKYCNIKWWRTTLAKEQKNLCHVHFVYVNLTFHYMIYLLAKWRIQRAQGVRCCFHMQKPQHADTQHHKWSQCSLQDNSTQSGMEQLFSTNTFCWGNILVWESFRSK